MNAITIRRGPDGLTKDERRRLYDPHAYDVLDVDGGWELTNGPAMMFARRGAEAGSLIIVSNTASFRFVADQARCSCPDAERHSERLCKHSAAWIAVAAHQSAKREQREALPPPFEADRYAWLNEEVAA